MSQMKINKAEALTLWSNGLVDPEIAKHFNCSKVAVSIWRKRNDLPSNKGIFDWGVHKESQKRAGGDHNGL